MAEGLKPLPAWRAREPVSHDRLNAMQNRSITDITVGPRLSITRVGGLATISFVNDPTARPSPLVRYKVTVVPAEGNDLNSPVILAKPVDASGAFFIGAEVPIVRAQLHSVGDIIFASEPSGGTGQTYASKPVTWQEFNDGGGTLLVQITSIVAAGKYIGKSVLGSTNSAPTGVVVMPEGMTLAATADTLIDDGTDGSVYNVGDYVVGKKSGFSTDGKVTVVLPCFPGTIPVNVTQSGGAAGSASAACTFTYNVTTTGGTSIGAANMAVLAARPVGLMTAGTHGMAFYLDGVLKLLWVDEIPGTAACT